MHTVVAEEEANALLLPMPVSIIRDAHGPVPPSHSAFPALAYCS